MSSYFYYMFIFHEHEFKKLITKSNDYDSLLSQFYVQETFSLKLNINILPINLVWLIFLSTIKK